MKREIEDLKSVNRRIVATLVRLEGKVDDMSARMLTKDDLGKIYNRFDELAEVVEDTRDRVILHASILTEHDERIKKLERRSQ